MLYLSTILLATKSPARQPVASKTFKLMLPFASSWEEKVSSTGSRSGEVDWKISTGGGKGKH